MTQTLRSGKSGLPRRALIVLETMLPSNVEGTVSIGILDAGWDGFYDDFQRQAHFSLRLGFRAALWVAIWLAPILIARAPPISFYCRETRERALLAWQHAQIYSLRQLFFLLKITISYCYGVHPSVRHAIRFPPAR